MGALDMSLIESVVKSHHAQIGFCYERELSETPALSGTMTVKFLIAKSGSVTRAETSLSTLNSPSLDECVNRRFLRMTFPPVEGGGIAVVKYQLEFAPPDSASSQAL